MDAIKDFIFEHKQLVIILGVVLVLIIVLFSIRSHNLKKKAEAEAQAQAEMEAILNQPTTVVQDEEPQEAPQNEYQASLGLIGEKDDRVVVPDEPEEPEELPQVVEPTGILKASDIAIKVYDHTNVPEKMVDGSSCIDYLQGVSLNDFGTMWGTALTEDDINTEELYLVGVEQNADDYINLDLQSFGWLCNNLGTLSQSAAIKFTNLHVIGDLTDSHLAVLCSYDWYSAFGLKDTLLVFEDISNTLKVGDLKVGDIFSTVVFVHNIKVTNVGGQRVICIEFTPIG